MHMSHLCVSDVCLLEWEHIQQGIIVPVRGTGNSGVVGVTEFQKETTSDIQISKVFPPAVHFRMWLVNSMPA